MTSSRKSGRTPEDIIGYDGAGDCFTYALAERTGYPVLCTGDDFAATGVPVLRPSAGDGEP